MYLQEVYEVQLDEDRAEVAQEVFNKYLKKDVSYLISFDYVNKLHLQTEYYYYCLSVK